MKIRQLPPYMIAVGILGLTILGLLIAIVSQQITSSALSSEISRERDALSRYKRDTDSFKQVTADYSDMSARLGGRYKEVSWTARMPFVVSSLSGITQAHHMRIETLKPEPTTAANSIYRLPMRITLKAQLGDLARLAQDVETSIPYMDIERMDIHMASDKSDALQCDMTISSFAVEDDEASQPMLNVGSGKPNDIRVSAAKNDSGSRAEGHRGTL